jgi:hypothetical protein
MLGDTTRIIHKTATVHRPFRTAAARVSTALEVCPDILSGANLDRAPEAPEVITEDIAGDASGATQPNSATLRASILAIKGGGRLRGQRIVGIFAGVSRTGRHEKQAEETETAKARHGRLLMSMTR